MVIPACYNYHSNKSQENGTNRGSRQKILQQRIINDQIYRLREGDEEETGSRSHNGDDDRETPAWGKGKFES